MDNEKIYSLLRQGEILEVEKELKSEVLKDKKLIILSRLVSVFKNEVSAEAKKTVFDYSTDIDELSSHYTKTKLMLKRIEYDMPQEYIDEAYEYWENSGVSIYMLSQMVVSNTIYKEKVCAALIELYCGRTGEKSVETQSLLRLYKYISEGNKNGIQ